MVQIISALRHGPSVRGYREPLISASPIGRRLTGLLTRLSASMTIPTKQMEARAHFKNILLTALNRHTKKGLLDHLEFYSEDERTIDLLGDLALDLQRDYERACTLHNGKAIRAFIRRRLKAMH